VVLDTGSRDRTPELLRNLGVTPHPFAWVDDFALARNASLAKATRGWVLWLDADDRPGPGFFEALEPLLKGPRKAWRLVVRSPREDSRGECFRQIRLFPNGRGLAFEGRVHEQLGTSLRRLGMEASDSDIELVHLGYGTAAQREAKRVRNLALLETERRDHPRDPVVAMEYGNCLYQGGDFAGAFAAYLAFLPDPDPARCGLPPADEALRHFPALCAGACLKLGEVQKAEAWYRLACRWNPADLQPFYWLGRRALEGGDVRSALLLFAEALDKPVSVGKVATDNATVRRNALAAAVLCEMQLHGASRAPRARAYLAELLGGGDLPLDPRVPFEFYRDAHDLEGLEAYLRKGLPEDADLSLWEDAREQLLAAGRPSALLACLDARPSLAMKSGTLEAFRGRALEETHAPAAEIYAAYRRALLAFPDDPTVLVYFSGYVNDNRLYARCYADLKAVPKPPAAVREFLRQLEAQGLAG
jgi:tetratricopeptide (TPR) repeat protein